MAPPNLVILVYFFKMSISKSTFAPSTPCTIHFECLESGPNDSTRVRRLTGILRRARVKIFILAYGSFWFQLSEFSSNLTGHHETKTAKPIWGCRSKYSNFFFKPRLLSYLWLTRTSWIDSAPSEPSNSTQSGHTGTNVDSFRQNEITKMTPNSAPTDFANFGRRYFHFQLAPSNKLGCYGLGMTSATIGDIVHGV